MCVTCQDQSRQSTTLQTIPRHRGAVLFVGEAVSMAHVSRPAVLARWARDAGYEVHFACGESYASIVRAEGFEPRLLPAISPNSFYSRLSNGEFFYKVPELENYVLAEVSLINDIKPDLIVGDFRLTLDISRTLTGVPLLSLSNAHWCPTSECLFPIPSSASFFRVLPASVGAAIFSLVRPLAFRTFAKPMNVVRSHFGLEPLNDFRRHYTAGNYCAYMDVPALSPIKRIPSGHFFLGPVQWQPREMAAPELEKLDTRRPLAYVSLGSSGETRVLPAVLRAVLAAGCDIALSGVTPEQIRLLNQSIGELQSRSISAPLLDPRRILERAAFTVCHGGSGTVYQSLSAGVPLLCLPFNPDQGLVAATVTAQGAGMAVDPSRMSSESLRPVLNALLANSRYVKYARQLSESISKHDTHASWLHFLNKHVPLSETSERKAKDPIYAMEEK